MNRTHDRLQVLLLALMLGLGGVAGAHASGNAALGNNGEVFIARVGTYGDLFPEGELVPADRPVLAVDRLAPDRPLERLLVPGTGNAVTERSPTVVYEKSSQRLYVIWEGMRNPTVSALLLAALDGNGWSEPIEISGDISPLKGEPQVLISTDQFTMAGAASGETVERDRTLFHIIWWEEGQDFDEIYFTPVILDDGVYIGWNPVFRLNDLNDLGPADEGKIPQALLRAPRILAGGDLSAAVIGFTDARSGRFLISETRLLPPELGMIADDIRSEIIELGRVGDDHERNSLFDKIRSEIIEIGHTLNPGAVNHLADQSVAAAQRLIDEDPDRPIEELAGDIRSEIIELGARILVDLEAASTAAPDRVLEIGARPDAPESVAHATHLVRLRLVSSRPTPPVPHGPVEIYLSEDGRRALVSWVEDGDLNYTETADTAPDGPWTAPRRLAIDEALGRAQAEQALRRRVSRRP